MEIVGTGRRRYHPSELLLEPVQVEKLHRFVGEVIKPMIEEMSEDDLDELHGGVTPTSPLTFGLYTTGLGTEISVKALGKEISLSICDDGEIVPDEWRPDSKVSKYCKL